MGFEDDVIAAQLREPQSDITAIYKKLHGEKRNIKKTIYPSHAPSLMTLFGSYSRSPSSSTNLSLTRFGKNLYEFLI